MNGLGAALRRARESHGLSVEEVAESTHINSFYLESLEDERLDVFPADVYGRGFLRSYAAFLDLQPEPLIEAFQEAGRSRPAPPDLGRCTETAGQGMRDPLRSRTRAKAEERNRRQPGRRSVTTTRVLPGTGHGLRHPESRSNSTILVCIIAACICFSALHHRKPLAQHLPGIQYDLSRTSSQATSTSTRGVTLALRATGYVYLKVVTDQGKQRSFQGEWMPGDHQIFHAARSIHLNADRGANLRAVCNGKDIGPLSRSRGPVSIQYLQGPVPKTFSMPPPTKEIRPGSLQSAPDIVKSGLGTPAQDQADGDQPELGSRPVEKHHVNQIPQ